MRITVFVTVSVLLALLLVFSGWAVWERHRDALQAIDIEPGKVTLKSDTVFTMPQAELQGRDYRHVVLETEHLGRVEAFASLPKKVPVKGLPVVIILGGLGIGAENFAHIPDPGDNIYVIYKYPYAPQQWYRGNAFFELPVIRKSALTVPSQTLTLFEWVSRQPWAEQGRVTFAGYSFGAMFMPALYRLAQSRKVALPPGVIAYGGTDIYMLLYANMKKVDTPWRSILAWLGETTIHVLEPARHMPYVSNEFLLMNGTRDVQIPRKSWEALHRLAPEPKTVVILDAGHMHPGKPELTEKLVDLSKVWLRERGVVN